MLLVPTVTVKLSPILLCNKASIQKAVGQDAAVK